MGLYGLLCGSINVFVYKVFLVNGAKFFILFFGRTWRKTFLPVLHGNRLFKFKMQRED